MRCKITIKGRVQGVFFRAFVRDNAKDLGLTGTVRNKNGYVEAIVEGPKEKVDLLVETCNKGPSAAEVDSVDVSEEKETGEFEGFRVIH